MQQEMTINIKILGSVLSKIIYNKQKLHLHINADVLQILEHLNQPRKEKKPQA